MIRETQGKRYTGAKFAGQGERNAAREYRGADPDARGEGGGVVRIDLNGFLELIYGSGEIMQIVPGSA